MISGIKVTPLSAGQYQIDYVTEVANVTVAIVNYGADSSYGLIGSMQAAP